MGYNWGPHYIVPSPTLKVLSGKVLLRERLDDELLARDLEAFGLTGPVAGIRNPWYFRKMGEDTWMKIGESEDRKENFPVLWDTTELKNGLYEVLGLMHVMVKKGNKECTIARENVVEVTIGN